MGVKGHLPQFRSTSVPTRRDGGDLRAELRRISQHDPAYVVQAPAATERAAGGGDATGDAARAGAGGADHDRGESAHDSGNAKHDAKRRRAATDEATSAATGDGGGGRGGLCDGGLGGGADHQEASAGESVHDETFQVVVGMRVEKEFDGLIHTGYVVPDGESDDEEECDGGAKEKRVEYYSIRCDCERHRPPLAGPTARPTPTGTTTTTRRP